jgi:hypothetical protein
MASRKKTPDAHAAQPSPVIDPAAGHEEERFDRALRPATLAEYVGQRQHVDNLKVFVEASRRRGEPLDHVLLCGPPGLGKTTLAHILAKEMGTHLSITSGPAVEHKGVLIVGSVNLAGKLAGNASPLYAKNLANFLDPLIGKDGSLNIDWKDEIIAGTLIAKDGALVHPMFAGK